MERIERLSVKIICFICQVSIWGRSRQFIENIPLYRVEILPQTKYDSHPYYSWQNSVPPITFVCVVCQAHLYRSPSVTFGTHTTHTAHWPHIALCFSWQNAKQSHSDSVRLVSAISQRHTETSKRTVVPVCRAPWNANAIPCKAAT